MATTWIDELRQRIQPHPHLNDPAGWIRTRLREHLWSKQREIVDAIRDHPKVAVHSCHDAGKSFIASRVADWWIDVHPEGSAFVASTAPTYRQVNAILWEEIRTSHQKGNLKGRVTQSDEWKIGDRLVGYGRKPADHDEHGFQGIHRRYVLVILDEACGIPPALWTGVDAITTNDDARILAIGNPDDETSEFARLCRPGSGWHVIRIDGLTTPNVDKATMAAALDEIGFGTRNAQEAEQRQRLLAACPDEREQVPADLRHLLLSPSWIADKARRWGVDSPLFTAKVRGEFPDTSAGSVIPLAWVRAAQNRWANRADPLPRFTQAGVDVADEGEDRTTIAYRHAWRIDRIEIVPPGDPMHTADQINAIVPGLSVVDGIGVGSGVVARLRQLGRPVVSFIASRGTDLVDQTGELGFINCRAAAWWALREMLDPINGLPIELPDDDELTAELTAPKWTQAGGRIKIESKDDIKKRLGRSTDLADSVIQAFWTDPTPVLEDADDMASDTDDDIFSLM
ncbi:hypothetical protein [Phytoactinopolyspora limicola]|uniref:hypothetical protein n=1 Tax=Phytoactinopolyspora limicola TaxID=2715536 RepID=UPI00140CDBAF|nr:hypothetical protein [Phytoactinopolyspora limicola]